MSPFAKPFWKVVEILMTKTHPVPPLKLNDNLLVSPGEKTNAIASHSTWN